uniref:GTP 3',8-cyclase n=1 Tax=Chromera velia CCMP2878 TaxID=1169474 RepID=A0A0G4HTN8_9ALVE|mmetsp:Transcript_398/g.915  ORF Transcript_398/g.915 Transcript_398/m.915 type:complete len:453 (-) Transcript_398:833-2191(-)|eukprot:Cvel_1345.t1-p1 / transcript=Cvel_1345.t1 / gene=Cvel_1345 / organism=Chromera_velia_CCMP2878 / gene_product=Molybdenum cofactor biosynthesis protein 1, putative / transcript_product=Molybdenum cofactor biosynthesis protein 1, putative / location=Cvel_scaffold46:54207-56423(-) / protein_length=452 / sequence_SO=supercontig / SO=protein_coding / is_pseudo=false
MTTVAGAVVRAAAAALPNHILRSCTSALGALAPSSTSASSASDSASSSLAPLSRITETFQREAQIPTASVRRQRLREARRAAARAAIENPAHHPQREWEQSPVPLLPHIMYPRNETPISPAFSSSEVLTDTFGRVHNYLRISLTEKCNLRCQYCMPEEGVETPPEGSLLTAEEVVRTASFFVEHGVNKIRLTGGEPTVRKDFSAILSGLGALPGLRTLGMTTNAVLLNRYLEDMREARVNAVNLSLDSLVPGKFALITRRDAFHQVWRNLHDLVAADFCQVKVNCVVMRNQNEDEIVDFVRLTKDMPIQVRFIEFMPFNSNGWSDSRLFPMEEMIATIRSEFPSFSKAPDPDVNETARLWGVPGFRGRVGFISSMTDLFCSSCNRLRLLADGQMKNCLFGLEEFDLRGALRRGESLERIVTEGVKKKKAAHGDMDLLQKESASNRSMIRIGG